MIDELEALVGHVFVVGGRAVSTTPPGALVQLPPKKPQRGREQDTFFILVTPAGANQGQASFYEQLARLAADLYFRSSGGVTSGLREAVAGVNSHLIEHNQSAGQRYEANMVCMVFRGREAYVARAGACLCMFRQGEGFVTFPDDLHDEYALNALPLGYSPVPDIKLAHYDVAPGHVMVLADAGLAQAERSVLFETLGLGGVQAVMEPLRTMGGPKLQAMIIEFVSMDTPDPAVLTPLPGSIVRSSSAPASMPVTNPASAVNASGSVPAAPASVPSTSVKSTSAKSTSVKKPSEPAKPAPAEAAQPASAAPISGRRSLFGGRGGPNAAERVRPEAVPADEGVPEANTPLRFGADRAGSGTGTGPRPSPIGSAAALGAAAAEALPPVSEIVAETGRTANRASRHAAGGVFSFLSVVTRGLGGVMDRMLPEPEASAPRFPAMIAAGLAILVPVIVVFVVVAFQLSSVDVTQFEQTVREVETARDQAASINLKTDSDRAKAAWLAVLQRVDQAETASGRKGDPTLTRIRQQAQGVLDAYALVTRRTVTPLRSFNEGVKLAGPIVRGGTDIYTMDLNGSAIFRDTLNQSASAIATRSTQPIVQLGQAVGARSVRKLVAMTWMAEGGVQRANVLAALDIQGLLITYSPTFSPATSQPLPGTDRWSKPVAITTWQKRLYILDPGANQIWRYVAEGDTYATPPEEYFDTEYRPDLRMAVDMVIDLNGNVYVLFSNGTLKKFNGGVEQRFDFNGLPDGALKSGNAMFLNNDVALPAIFITDPLDNSIYEITLAGTFQHRYRAADDNAFRSLSGVYVDRERVYVVSGSLLYQFSISDTTATPTPRPQQQP